MSMLGEILARLRDRSEIYVLLVEAGDLSALAALERAAACAARDPCELALDAVHSFTETADGEAWTKLIGRIQDAESPGAACLSEMISWSLARQGG